ncbi:apolipoprotein L1 isoform X5 [Clupea harengus]|uniref:Apolipoprotein L1 isoform X5 n=1 Tax=Clupea harengus TaxID=7950 RepID=A0A8M1KAJ4_CLUHA|nr:apolipoprotein L1 isoform X5 [Clupea harengus]
MEWTLDLECEEGTNMEKNSGLSGILRRSSKISESSGLAQEQNGNLSKSNDNLSDNGMKDKAGVFSGMFKKNTKPAEDRLPNKLSASNDSLNANNNTKEKGGVFSGILKKAAKPSGDGLSTQVSLGDDHELSASNDSLSDKTNPKEKGGMLSGMFRKSPKPPGGMSMSQATLSVDKDLSASNDSLSESSTKKENLCEQSDISASNDSLSENSNPKATLSVDKDLSASNDSLSESSTKKEKPGMLSGMFKRSPKPNHKRTASQENLCEQSDISASNDSLSENSNSKTGMMGKIRRNPFQSTAQDRERTEKSSDAKISQPKQEKGSDSETEEIADSGRHAGHKQNVLVGAMSKLNPFRPATKEDKESERDDEDVSAGSDNHSHRKQNVVVGALTKLNPFRSAPKKLTSEMESEDELERDHNEMKKELSSTASSSQLRTATAGESQVNGKMTQRENKSMAKPPPVPPKPKEKELTARMKEIELKEAQTKVLQGNGAECCDEARQGSKEEKEDGEEESVQSTTKKAKKPKNLSMPQVETKDESDDGLEDRRVLSTEENIPEQEAPSTKPKKKKNPKKAKNPFMSKLATKGKTLQKKNENEEGAPGDGSAEGNGQKKSLFEQLDELRFDKPEDEEEEEEDKDLDGLMEWWNTVEQWEDMQQNDDMTEKEEAKAFALTADKVQKGIRVFNKLFTERAEGLWQHVIDLNAIADGLDTFNKKTKIAQITGGSTSAVGGTLTIAGLALAPVTLGTSLIVTAVGLGIAAAGGLTSASAGISNQVNNSLDRKKVERIVEDYQAKISDLNKCMKFIKQGIENLRRFDLIKMKKQAYNQDFPALNNIYEDGAMAGKAILINANEIMRVVQIANVAGSTAARAVQIASMATGILTGLFVGMDIYFVAKDSRELKKGAKSEFAAKIREVAEQLHGGLVELNGIREELQSTTGPEGKADSAQPESRDDTEDIDEIKRKLKSNPPPSYDDTADIDESKRKLKSNPPPSYDDTVDIDESKRKLKSNPPPSYDDTVDIDETKRKLKSNPHPSTDDTDKIKGKAKS